MVLKGRKTYPLHHSHNVLMPARSFPSLRPEKWLVERLKNTAESDPRYEASWYGPYNALLSHYFPYQQQFLVKPQPKIRDEEEANISFSSVQAESSMRIDDPSEEASSMANLSMISTGLLVVAGTGPTYVPDFIVTKATPFPSHDAVLLLVEVKRTEPKSKPEWMGHSQQILRYMESLAKHMSGKPLVGLLICGTKVKIYRSAGAEAVTWADPVCSINSKAVRQLLLRIATDSWQI